ncbi:hypothetical protein LCGC14_1800840 [marine sediment metagenome]|uniref:PARP-type domain-containing protein n=1 Tax=marine sediment metagenome TaxID=412755 RepID=A0A0F9HCG1_9ZZZZ
MSYGKILGRLVVTRRGTPRKTTRSGQCVYCNVRVDKGEVHPILLRSVKSKKSGTMFWITRRFHMVCFPKWMATIYKRLPEMEALAMERRGQHRQRPVLSKIEDPEKLIGRRKMVKRRSYLINRILKERPPKDKKEDLESQIRELGWYIHQIVPGLNFATEKRKVLFNEYIADGNEPLNIEFDETAETNPEWNAERNRIKVMI